jgi:hypothetical protein
LEGFDDAKTPGAHRIYLAEQDRHRVDAARDIGVLSFELVHECQELRISVGCHRTQYLRTVERASAALTRNYSWRGTSPVKKHLRQIRNAVTVVFRNPDLRRQEIALFLFSGARVGASGSP